MIGRRGAKLLRCLLRLPFDFHVSLHFEARQEFDIAGSAIRTGFAAALGFGAGTKLQPFRLKLVARLRLIVCAPFLYLYRAAFALALASDIELRYSVRDRDGLQRSQDNDRQVYQHFVRRGCMT